MPAGRPRSEEARVAILEATRTELIERGFDRLTIDRISVTSGISKPTVYRWYSSKNAIVADCLIGGYISVPTVPVREDGDVASDILQWMQRFAAITKDERAVKLIRAASAAGAEDPEIARAFQQQMTTTARDGLTSRIQRAIAAGEVRPGTPAEVIADVIVGSLLYRLVTHDEVPEEFVQQLAGAILTGILAVD